MIKRAAGSVPAAKSPTPRRGASAQLSRKPIIEREEVDARKKASRIIAEAEHQAQHIIEESKVHAEKIRTRGWSQGQEEGKAEYTEKITEALLALEKKAAALEAGYVALVRTCVEKILGQELKSHPEAVVGVVRNALNDARQQREIIVRVNPADADVLKQNERRLLEKLARANNVDVREDASIQRGGCIVMTELGTIDASLDRQLQAIESALDTELNESQAGRASSAPELDEDALDLEDDPGYGQHE